MRVVVATDHYPALTSAQAGAIIGAAWADRGAQVAVVPIGVAGAGVGQAVADLWGAETSLHQIDERTITIGRAASPSGQRLVISVHEPATPSQPPYWEDSSAVCGEALVIALDEIADAGPVAEIVLDVAEPTWQDGGRGLLTRLGLIEEFALTSADDQQSAPATSSGAMALDAVRERLRGARLFLAAPAEWTSAPLVGLRGITSRAAHALGNVDPAEMLARDQALVDLAASVAASPLAHAAGSGAVGGLGFAVLALGGQVLSGPQLCADLAGLEQTLNHADLVVTGGDRLDFGTMGGDVLTTIRQLAEQALRPCVVIAGENFISSRELRSIGVEAAYAVRRPGPDELAAGLTPLSADELRAAADQVAASWAW